MTKPTSKVIQISATQCPESVPVIYHLCEDGSVWQYHKGEWDCTLEAQMPICDAKFGVVMSGGKNDN